MKNYITLDSIHTFLEAAKADLLQQQEEFGKKYTGLIVAIDEARQFAIDHHEELNEGRYIAIVERDGKIQKVGWEKDIPNPQGTLYRFDPKSDATDPYSMGEYIRRREQYSLRLDELEQAIEMIKKLQSRKYSVQDPVELLPVTRVIDQHNAYLDSLLDNNPTEEQLHMIDTQRSIIEKFLEIMQKQEKPKGNIKRIFIGAKEKLRKMRKRRKEE